jgi:hypothetical protein
VGLKSSDTYESGEFISGNYPMETVKLRRGILRERRALSGDRQLD